MPKYGSKAKKTVKSAMHRKEKGTLKSGRSGKKVTSRKQAIAIGLSEAARKGRRSRRRKRSPDNIRKESCPGVTEERAPPVVDRERREPFQVQDFARHAEPLA